MKKTIMTWRLLCLLLSLSPIYSEDLRITVYRLDVLNGNTLLNIRDENDRPFQMPATDPSVFIDLAARNMATIQVIDDAVIRSSDGGHTLKREYKVFTKGGEKERQPVRVDVAYEIEIQNIEEKSRDGGGVQIPFLQMQFKIKARWFPSGVAIPAKGEKDVLLVQKDNKMRPISGQSEGAFINLNGQPSMAATNIGMDTALLLRVAQITAR